MKTKMAGHFQLQELVAATLGEVSTKLASSNAKVKKLVEYEKKEHGHIPSVKEEKDEHEEEGEEKKSSIDFTSVEEVSKLASALDYVAEELHKQADSVFLGGESPQGGMVLPTSEAVSGRQPYGKDSSRSHNVPMSTGMESKPEMGSAQTATPDTLKKPPVPLNAKYPEKGVLKTSTVKAAGRSVHEQVGEARGRDVGGAPGAIYGGVMGGIAGADKFIAMSKSMHPLERAGFIAAGTLLGTAGGAMAGGAAGRMLGGSIGKSVGNYRGYAASRKLEASKKGIKKSATVAEPGSTLERARKTGRGAAKLFGALGAIQGGLHGATDAAAHGASLPRIAAEALGAATADGLFGAASGYLTGRAIHRVTHGKASGKAPEQAKTASPDINFILNKIAESKGGGMTLDSKSGEGPKPPSDSAGGNDARRFLESNEAAVRMQKVDGKKPQKRMLAEVLSEPAQSKAHDSKVHENLRNASKGGVKIAGAREALESIKLAGCTCNGGNSCKYCKMKTAASALKQETK